MKNIDISKLHYPYTVWQFLLLLLVGIVICSPGVALIKTIGEEWFVTGFYFALCFVVIALVYVINRKRGVGLQLTWKISNKRFLILMSLCVLIFQIGVNVPINFLITTMMHKEYKFIPESLHYVLGGIILAPILEELIFRKFLLGGLLQVQSVKKAIIISSVVFCIVHVMPAQLFGAFCIGLFFCYIYYKTRSIGYTIILHALANIVGFGWPFFFIRWGQPLIDNKLYLCFYILISTVIVFSLIRQLQIQFAKSTFFHK